VARLRGSLAKLGWIEGRNLRLDIRSAYGNPDRLRGSATELVGLAPEVIFVLSAPATKALRGTKVGDLPVQFPTKFDLVINLKTAKQLGFAIPEPFLQSADEVIE
jgi:hypothetical protein